ncbi:type I polyketide synthase [Roseimaritima ulvae]
MGCRLPGGIDSPTAFWRALLERLDAIGDVPPDRWNHARFHDTNPEKSGSIRNAKGGFIEGIDQFDAEFFGYFPIAAQRIDPQQRLLLEVTHEAMEDAGLRRDQLNRSRTAVFVGSFMYDYLCIQAASEQRDEIGTHTAMGTANCSLANRISYEFDLTGPSVSLDTACSASLTALHLACQSVWTGEAEMAIAGGVNLMLRPESSIMLSKGGFLNPDQYCKAFDESANGYVRGEGVGIVILKPLAKALADGDAIYACVRGSAANQDGYLPEGFTVPNVRSQVALLESVYHQAGIDPTSVDYVEAHGTGTPVGDPVETSALGSVLGYGRTAAQPNLWIGSVKTNLGHLEGASGIAGFMKGVLTAYHGVVPPNLHFHNPNPAIPWEHYCLQVPTQREPLNRSDRPAVVGVNSFGAGGSNTHVVLQACSTDQAPPPANQPAHPPPAKTLYMLSANSREALRMLAVRHADFLEASPHSLRDIAYSAMTRRSHYPQLLAVVGDTAADLANQLRHYADGQPGPEIATGTVAHQKTPKLAFMFSGQGGQWAQMGLQLYETEPVFRESTEHIDSLFQTLSGWSILAELRKQKSESKVDDTVVVQPAVMAIQISLLKLYAHYGIQPDAVVGHSIGEVAAGFAAGSLTLEQAVRVIYYRSQAQNRAAGKGGMLAVGLALDSAQQLIEDFPGVSIGTVNGPEMLTLSGDTQPLQQIAAMLEKREIFNRQVNVEVAYHSHHMDAIEDLMLESLADVQGVCTRTPLYSTVTTHREQGEHLNAGYWYRNVREPVLFTDTLDTMAHDGYDTFVEIGPHPVLVRGAEAQLQSVQPDAVVAAAMTRTEPQPTVFLQSLARLAARGCQPDTKVLFGSPRQYIRLPQNPWQHRRHWFEPPAAAEVRKGQFSHPFLKRQTQWVSEDGLAVWEANLDVQKFPYLRDHQVDGEILFPATGHLELAWAVASEQFRHESFFLEDLHFDSPLILPENSRHPLEVRLEVVSSEGDYRICSRAAPEGQDEANWTKHSSGRINTAHDRFDSDAVELDVLVERFADSTSLEVEPFYAHLQTAGLNYGECFRCITELRHNHPPQSNSEWLVCLRLPDALLEESSRNTIHPAILDACLHALFADVHSLGLFDRIYLPHRIGGVKFFSSPTQGMFAHVTITRNDEQFLCSDTLILSEKGDLVAKISGLTCKRLANANAQQIDRLYDGCYEYQWGLVPRELQRHERTYDLSTAVLLGPERPTEFQQHVLERVSLKLEQANISSTVIYPRSNDSVDELLSETPLDRRTLLVFAGGLSEETLPWKGLDSYPAVPMLLQLAQTLQKREGVPRFCVVTNGATAVSDDKSLDLGQAILHGMSRVINNECPSIPLALIDLPGEITQTEIDTLVDELLHIRRDQDESEIAFRGSQRYVRQLVPVTREAVNAEFESIEDGCGGSYRAELHEPGMLDHVVFRRLPPTVLKEDEVEIAVRAAGLSFKDVMNVMGMLPDRAVAGGLTGRRLGFEVSGRVLRTGQAVTNFQPDDEVVARVREGFCGRVVANDCHVSHYPDKLSPVQAASIPLVFVAAWYALCHLARMEKGETLLLHSAAGGVGGAAIQLAQRAGVNVIATAGTKRKRQFLHQQGIKHVFDSRSMDFSNKVMEATNERGVDIVLNFLTGRLVTQSLKCLAPFGRFVELGKSDIYRNHKLNLERLSQNISYFVVDIDRLAQQKPELHREAMREVLARFASHELQPLDITEFSISKLPEAFQFMTRSAYHGKIVLNMESDVVHSLPPRKIQFRTDRTYLISGGASGFGLEIARWMVDRGATSLVLLSRSGPKIESDHAAIATMQSLGVTVRLPQVDVTNQAAVDTLLQSLANEPTPLAGIIHAAAVMDDATLANIDLQRFKTVFLPKAEGAWNLHNGSLKAKADLDFFVMLSSISSIFGFVGQVNYAAANYFQDQLAHFRRQQGLPATSINLGVLGQYAGLSRSVNQDQDVIGLLESFGMLEMHLSDVLEKLEAALIQQPAQRMTAQIDWAWFRSAYPHLARDSRYIELMGDEALARAFRPKGSGLVAELLELDAADRTERLQQELAGVLARILDVAPNRLDVATSIDNLGLDSMMLTELQIWIGRLLNITLPLIKLLKGPSIAALAAELLSDIHDRSDDLQDSYGDASNDQAYTLADMEEIQVLNPWLIRGAGSEAATCRLVCFHSMGVGASLFTNFLIRPPENVDILAVQTPGRENRGQEPPAETVAELVENLAPQLLELFDRPVIFWGHSYGGIVAAEVSRWLHRYHDLQPQHLMVSGTVAPHLVHLWQKREVMLKAMVSDNSPEYLVSMSRYVDDPDFLKSIIPLMRRDWSLLKNYDYRPFPPFDFPITAFAARQDDMVYTDEIEQWDQHTECQFRLTEVEGDHWFLNRNRGLIADTINQIAESLDTVVNANERQVTRHSHGS